MCLRIIITLNLKKMFQNLKRPADTAITYSKWDENVKWKTLWQQISDSYLMCFMNAGD